MAPPPDPPPPDWDLIGGVCPEFKSAQAAAQGYGYDANSLSILDSAGAHNYLYFGKSATTPGHVAWFFRNAGSGGTAPFAKISAATFAVINGGKIDTSTGKITFAGTVYRLDVRLDGTGTQIAYANPV